MKANSFSADGIILFEGGMTIDLDELLSRVINDLENDKQSQGHLLELLYRQLPTLRSSLFEQHAKPATPHKNKLSAAS
ncbi:hypothetical protein EDC56_2326 [Sinobacterium caligoides]|uniref:Uncharacterized protein n=1 Tax=Sinobacterium caligoides TaxID=933926 RepID=A0A3N2DQ05_9GAMM|nr:hypothetical protein [Sinobacterium caligoides]ROS01877.1 hypothetical protein EDC56_2326 [Sinobacterium caligoides]